MIKNGIFLFILAFFVLAVFIPSYTQMQSLRERNRNLQTQIDTLKALNARMAQEKKNLENDPVYLERVARDKMGLVKKGEVVYKLMPENSDK